MRKLLILNIVAMLVMVMGMLFTIGFTVGSTTNQASMPVIVNESSFALYERLPEPKIYDTIVLEFANRYNICEDERKDIMQMVADEADRQGVDRGLALAVAFAESSFNHESKSRAGAVGVMQLMPIWGDDIHHLDVNISKGISLLKERLDKYDGDEYKTLKYYNGGWKAFSERHARVNRKTSLYAKKVMRIRDKIGGI